MKAARRWALMGLCALLLSGCAAVPPENVIRDSAEDQALISADTRDLPPDQVTAALYFRYGNTAYLAAQERLVSVQKNETLEKALVASLLDGPAAAPALNSLFPPGTQLLATASQGNTLFLTFNESFMGRYADETGDFTDAVRAEGILRRQLCLDALSATLTEAGLCAQVQVLVYRGASQGTSMRLPAGFLDQSGDETLLPPLTRNESTILTPHNTAALILNAWMGQDWAALYDLTARGDERPREQSVFDVFAEGRALAAFTLSPGSVAQDGQSAVVGADLTLQGEAGNEGKAGYPLRLIRESGLWKIRYEDLVGMMYLE